MAIKLKDANGKYSLVMNGDKFLLRWNSITNPDDIEGSPTSCLRKDSNSSFLQFVRLLCVFKRFILTWLFKILSFKFSSKEFDRFQEKPICF